MKRRRGLCEERRGVRSMKVGYPVTTGSTGDNRDTGVGDEGAAAADSVGRQPSAEVGGGSGGSRSTGLCSGCGDSIGSGGGGGKGAAETAVGGDPNGADQAANDERGAGSGRVIKWVYSRLLRMNHAPL